MKDKILNRFKKSETKARPSFAQVISRLVFFVLFILSIRWFLIEPFLVPSGSMFPNLFVKDYIAVTKLTTGLKLPFTNKWLWGPHLPQRGQIVVFKSKQKDIYFVKRLIGLPGDRISVYGNKILKINDQKVLGADEPEKWLQFAKRFDPKGLQGLKLFSEKIQDKKYLTMYPPLKGDVKISEYHVPKGQLFFMGDNRSASSDSRSWGTVPVENIVGPVWKIFLSCEKKSIQYDFCDLTTIRWDRVFSSP